MALTFTAVGIVIKVRYACSIVLTNIWCFCTVTLNNNLANLYIREGKYGLGEEVLLKYLPRLEKKLGTKHPIVATTYTNLSEIYSKLGKYEKAELYAQRGLNKKKDTQPLSNPLDSTYSNNVKTISYDLSNYDSYLKLATISSDKGDYIEAKTYLEKALNIAKDKRPHNHPDIGIIYNQLGILSLKLKRHVEAIKSFQETLKIDINTLLSNHPEIAITRVNLATVYLDSGNFKQAKVELEKANSILSTIKDSNCLPEKIGYLSILGQLYLKQGEKKLAEIPLQETIKLRRNVFGSQHPDLANDYNNLAWLRQAQGEFENAIKLQTRSLNIQEENISTIIKSGSEAQKQAYMASLETVTKRCIASHFKYSPHSVQAIRLALTTILQRKGRILDLVVDSLKILRQKANSEAQVLIEELSAVRSELSDLIFNQPKHLSSQEYKKRISNLKALAEQLEKNLSHQSSQILGKSQLITIEAVQKSIPANAVLLEFFLYEPSTVDPMAIEVDTDNISYYLVYILHPQGEPEWVNLGQSEPIDELIHEFRSLLSNSKSKIYHIKELGKRAFTNLIEPIFKLIGKSRTIMISPDGKLNLLPFVALVDSKNRYLLETYTITYLNSGRDLLQIGNALPSLNPPLLIADPDFDNSNSQKSNIDCDDLQLKRNLDLSKLRAGKLPWTAKEVQAIAELIPQSKILTGYQATETAVKQAKSPSILHLATHGFFLEDLPSVVPTDPEDNPLFSTKQNSINVPIKENPLLRSGLIFAGFNNRKEISEDCVLTALEASGLNLQGTKLVVLSACETGLGEIANGQGVYGLRRAFVIAGAETLVMSLWSVSDQGTAQLMTGYYQRLLKGEARGKALRQIQLEMLQNSSQEKYTHPYYWSGFIVSGNWRRIRTL